MFLQFHLCYCDKRPNKKQHKEERVYLACNSRSVSHFGERLIHKQLLISYPPCQEQGDNGYIFASKLFSISLLGNGAKLAGSSPSLTNQDNPPDMEANLIAALFPVNFRLYHVDNKN